jgi:hypothetical protein
MAEKDKKSDWGTPVPPSDDKAPPVAPDKTSESAEPVEEVVKPVIDTSQYPTHWVFSDACFPDGFPRVKMWRDPYGAAPYHADVHPSEVPAWSQTGWNIGDAPQKEDQR